MWLSNFLKYFLHFNYTSHLGSSKNKIFIELNRFIILKSVLKYPMFSTEIINDLQFIALCGIIFICYHVDWRVGSISGLNCSIIYHLSNINILQPQNLTNLISFIS